MSTFQKKFLKILEAPEDLPEPIDGGLDDEAAFNDGLDKDTSPNEFDDVPDNPVNIDGLKQQQADATIGKLTGWVENIGNWVHTLNDPTEGSGSMSSELSRSDCDSIMADVYRGEHMKISRIAQELSALQQSLNQYIAAAGRKQTAKENL